MHVTLDLPMMVSLFVGAVIGLVLGILIPPPRWFCRAADWVLDRLGA